jgi:hypothetical protein
MEEVFRTKRGTRIDRRDERGMTRGLSLKILSPEE